MRDFKFIFKDDQKYICGEVKNSRLISYYDLKFHIKGNIYRAKVESYIKSIDAYILDIGEFKNAILKKSQRTEKFSLGDDILVEVVNVPEDEKLIEVTQKITITDGNLIISKYLSGKVKNSFEYENYTFIKRSGFDEDSCINRCNNLISKYEKIFKEKNLLPTPKLIHRNNFMDEFLIDCSYEVKTNIDINGYKADLSFNPQYDTLLNNEIKAMTQRSIDLQNSSITIDRLEALTVIDVNSKSAYKDLDKEVMSYKVNDSCLEEICIQIKLRNIKKMVMIDFIRMKDEENKFNIIGNFKNISKKYGLKIKFLGFSNLGLYEIIVF
ncbi:MAG: ribonuclease E/G [Tissierellia bacterium]|nr:ribonuclease E/G [Tissierellia bacterium]